jgi:hypothetical protein
LLKAMLVGAVAVQVPLQALPLPLANVKPVGNVSVNAILLMRDVFAAGLASENVSVVVPFTRIEFGENALLKVGGAMTVRVAEAVAPEPPSVEVTALVTLFFVPAAVPVTLTANEQLEAAATCPPDRETDVAPAVAEMVPPPQEPVRPFGVATTRPAGSESVKATPVSAVAAFEF